MKGTAQRSVPRSLFKVLKPKKQLHPSFTLISTSPRNKSTRQMMNAAFARFSDRDGNFIEQFQSTGFDNRTFELYVSELLHEEGFVVVGDNPQPDFIVEKDGVRIAIECTTTNRTDKGDGKIRPYEPLNDRDADLVSLKARAENEVPIRIGGALRNKMLHRVGKREPRAYWELPHVMGKPFILAIQAFHEHGSLGFSSAPVASYLYGIRQSPSWDREGNLVINTEKVAEHSFLDKQNIPSGFFDIPGSENVSAILWTNAGTVPKFTRMALAGAFPDGDVTMLRYGTMYDEDPNAHAALPFAYIVGDEGTPEETWGQEAVLLHNPSAINPVPRGLFEGLTESVLEDGTYADYAKSSFLPYMSISHLIDGPGHRRAAMTFGERAFEVLSEMYDVQRQKGLPGQP